MKGFVWGCIERFAGVVASQQFQNSFTPGLQLRRVRAYPHAFRKAGLAGRHRPLMPVDFNPAQAAIARGLHARVVTQCRKTDTGILDSFQYRETCRELQRAPIDRNMRGGPSDGRASLSSIGKSRILESSNIKCGSRLASMFSTRA